ncbi:MAG: hypothetical protein WAX44_00080 [Minisyncoccia bacterium]
MPFESSKPEEKNEKIGETSQKLAEIVDTIDVDILERAIRFMPAGQRETLYRAVEISKTATDDLMKE